MPGSAAAATDAELTKPSIQTCRCTRSGAVGRVARGASRMATGRKSGGFRVEVDLSLWFPLGDVRRRAALWVSAARAGRSVGALARLVARTFALGGGNGDEGPRLRLLAGGLLLPHSEPAALLRPGDTLAVLPPEPPRSPPRAPEPEPEPEPEPSLAAAKALALQLLQEAAAEAPAAPPAPRRRRVRVRRRVRPLAEADPPLASASPPPASATAAAVLRGASDTRAPRLVHAV